ncbi:hypothetical protein OSK11_25500, partial [Escherichia coli]|nr:hypothetical protein [Escherichia coli]
LPSEIMIWQPEFTDKILSRKPGAVHFPKKTCLAQYTQHELDLVAAQLNNRPRKTLKFKTPKEIIERGVALTD